MTEDSIKVIVRFRPQVSREIAAGSWDCVDVKTAEKTIEVDTRAIGRDEEDEDFKFNFDAVLAEDSTQDELFAEASYLIQATLEGYNATIFAYGASGSGKTWSLAGPDINDLDNNPGIIPNAMDALFKEAAKISAADPSISFEYEAEYIEIYAERVRCLLNDVEEEDLKIREKIVNGGKQVYVEGNDHRTVSSFEETISLIQEGQSKRAVASTGLNDRSSRSHTIFIINVSRIQEGRAPTRATFTLVDLAGSERVEKTGAKRGSQAFKEGLAINGSLLALGNVISALSKKAKFIPYRSSNLTRLLSNIGGNAKTAVVLCASPSSEQASETISTLRFGKRCKLVTGSAKRNIADRPLPPAEAKKLFAQLSDLKAENAALRAKIGEIATGGEFEVDDNVPQGTGANAEGLKAQLDAASASQEAQKKAAQALHAELTAALMRIGVANRRAQKYREQIDRIMNEYEEMKISYDDLKECTLFLMGEKDKLPKPENVDRELERIIGHRRHYPWWKFWRVGTSCRCRRQMARCDCCCLHFGCCKLTPKEAEAAKLEREIRAAERAATISAAPKKAKTTGTAPKQQSDVTQVDAITEKVPEIPKKGKVELHE